MEWDNFPDIPSFLIRKEETNHISIEVDDEEKENMVDLDLVRETFPVIKDYKTDKGIKIDSVQGKIGGYEPYPNSSLTTDAEMAKAYAFYSHWYRREDSKQWLLEYLRHVKFPYVEEISRLPVTALHSSPGWVARLKLRGCTISDETEKYFFKKINEYVKAGSEVVIEVKEESRSKTNYEMLYAYNELDEMIDRIADGDDSENIKTAILSKTHPKYMLEYFKNRWQGELEELELIGKDSQVSEAYATAKKERIKRLKETLKDAIDAINVTTDNQTRQRKVRVKKATPASVLVKAIELAGNDPESLIASMPAEGIIGSTTVVIYNIKTQFIAFYKAKENETLSVKGKSIINFNPDTSTQRKLRKPKETLTSMATATKKGVERVYDALTTKPSTGLSGRLNSDCILFKVYK